MHPEKSALADCDCIEAKAVVDWHRQCPTKAASEHDFQCLAIGHGCAVSLPRFGGPVFNRMFGLSTSDELEQAYSWMQQKAGARYLQWIQNGRHPTSGAGWN